MKIYRIFFECRSLGEVNVVVYVILAEAVISGALRAVAELKIGIVGVCAAAHGARMRRDSRRKFTVFALGLCIFAA